MFVMYNLNVLDYGNDRLGENNRVSEYHPTLTVSRKYESVSRCGMPFTVPSIMYPWGR